MHLGVEPQSCIYAQLGSYILGIYWEIKLLGS